MACKTNSEGELWITPTSKSELYVGDENGNVYVWKAASPQNYHQKCCFEGSGVPCTVVAARGNVLCAGLRSGHVRIFDLKQGRVAFEVRAHSRWLSDMKIHPTRSLFVTVAEDSSLRFWTLPPSHAEKVRAEFANVIIE